MEVFRYEVLICLSIGEFLWFVVYECVQELQFFDGWWSSDWFAVENLVGQPVDSSVRPLNDNRF